MAQETTEFDKYLKEHLHRDLIFRSVIWAALTIFAEYVAVNNSKTTILEYVARQSNSIMVVANIGGVVALALAIVAWAFKDAEFLEPIRFGQDTSIGKFGGFFRRLAGDLTLWTTGALFNVLVVAITAVRSVRSLREVPFVLATYVFLGVLTLAVGWANVITRRVEPSPWAEHFQRGKTVILVYVAALIFIAVGVRFFG